MLLCRFFANWRWSAAFIHTSEEIKGIYLRIAFYPHTNPSQRIGVGA